MGICLSLQQLQHFQAVQVVPDFRPDQVLQMFQVVLLVLLVQVRGLFQPFHLVQEGLEDPVALAALLLESFHPKFLQGLLVAQLLRGFHSFLVDQVDQEVPLVLETRVVMEFLAHRVDLLFLVVLVDQEVLVAHQGKVCMEAG